MNGFEYYTPTRVVFGRGAVERVGELARGTGGGRVLIVYGGGSVKRSGLLDRVKASLDGAGVAHSELGGVVPNPRLSLVYEGVELARREGAELILAVGGGSVIDTAKAIGYGVANEGDVWDFYAYTRRAAACLPVGVVLTLAATGSEMSNSSVITNEDGWIKRGYSNDLSRPRFAVMDPELTLTLPDYQTACGCTDILMHTMERYFTSGGHMELTDSMAEALMRTVIANARILKSDPGCYDARAEVMWAGSLSHNGLTGCGIDESDFCCHALEHELGGLYDVAHGAGLAAVWGSWARYVMADCLHRFRRFAVNVMGVEDSGAAEATALCGIEALEAFFTELGMPTSIRGLGVDPTEEELNLLAKKCAAAAGGKKGSAKVLYEQDMLKIYRMASGK